MPNSEGSPSRTFGVLVAPERDESLIGFITRALAETAVQSTHAALHFVGIDVPPAFLASSPDDLEFERLATLFGIARQEIEFRLHRHEMIAPDAPCIAFLGAQLHPARLERRRRRVSPLALRRSPHSRAVWAIRALGFDPDSLETLIDTCPACRRPLGWARAYGAAHCDSCRDGRGNPATDLRDYTQPKVEVRDEGRLSFVTDLISPLEERRQRARSVMGSELSSVSTSAAFEAILSVADELQGNRRTQRRSPSAPDVLCLAAGAFLGIPAEVEKVLSQLGNDAGVGARRASLSRLASDPYVTERLRRAFKKAHSGFRRRAKLMGDAGLKEAPKLAAQLGLSPKQVTRLSRSGLVPALASGPGTKSPRLMAVQHVRALVPALQNSIHEKEARRPFGLTVRVLELLAQSGVLSVVNGPVTGFLGKGAYYRRSEIQAFWKAIDQQLLVSLQSRSMPIRAALAPTGPDARHWVAALILLHGGEVLAARPSEVGDWRDEIVVTDPAGFRSRVLDLVRVTDGTRTQASADAMVSTAEAAEMLNTRVTVVGRLSASGLLQAVARRPTRFRLQDVLDFRSKYMLGKEIMHRFGLGNGKQLRPY